ncbi:alanyl-tRNA synthetase [Cladochytrium replicatum]|nr:alanyl-tRNA synthetase [Cladochytrium replicatum]
MAVALRSVKPSPTVPSDNPSILGTVSGMAQFQPICVGSVDPNSDMANIRVPTNTQKCIGAGGKHNDMDDVGKDSYHHTFFEMLGNWSFGDYFKLLTEVYKLPEERIYITYFGGDEQLCLARFIRSNRRYQCISTRQDDPNVVEIWNLVVTEYNSQPNGPIKPLPQKHDTGMGFERIVSVLQNKSSNYYSDIFTPILEAIPCKVGEEDIDGIDTAYMVVADHIRTLTFAISNSVIDGRGYVLRQHIGLTSMLGLFFPENTQRLDELKSILNKVEQ